jgi:hypothetical protein
MALATAALPALPLAAQTKDFSQHIVWWDAEHHTAKFIPGALLDSPDLKELPIPLNQIEDLLERQQAKQHTRLQESTAFSACSRVSESGLATWTPLTGKDAGITEFLASVLMAFRGTVLDVVPGWKTGLGARVVTLVYMEVSGVLVCNLGHLRDTRRVDAGDIVAVEIDKGSFEMGGMQFCNETDNILTVPKAGDEVVATGVPSAFDPYYAGPGAIFPVHLGEILPQPYEGLGRREPVALAQTQEDLGVALTPLTSCEGLVP